MSLRDDQPGKRRMTLRHYFFKSIHLKILTSLFCFFNIAWSTDALLKHKRDKLKFGKKGGQKI